MEKSRIIYLGNQETYPPKSYTFAELAAEIKNNDSNYNHIMTPKSKWEDVAREISGNDIGVIAYENAIVGLLKDNEELIDKYGLKRIKTVVVPVVLCAGIYPGSKNNYSLHSYKDALTQCKKYIAEIGLQGKEIPANSTSEGVSIVKQNRNGIAIARKEALLDAGLDVIAENISDKKQNFTKFHVVKRQN